MDLHPRALSRWLPWLGFILAVEAFLGCFRAVGYGIVHYACVSTISLLTALMMLAAARSPGRSILRSSIVLSLLAIGLIHLGSVYASYLLSLPRVLYLASLGELLMGVAAPGLWAAAMVSPGATVNRLARRFSLLALAGLVVSAFKDLLDLSKAPSIEAYFSVKVPPIHRMATVFQTLERAAILLVCILFLLRAGDRAAARINSRLMTVWFVLSFLGGIAFIVYGHINYDYSPISFYWWRLTIDTLTLTATLCIGLALKDAGDSYKSTTTAHS